MFKSKNKGTKNIYWSLSNNLRECYITIVIGFNNFYQGVVNFVLKARQPSLT